MTTADKPITEITWQWSREAPVLTVRWDGHIGTPCGVG